MRYESEVLYDLMKRDGLLNPSQEQLPYESELKEKYVDEVKGAYPKVTDYRPEWLNYNLGYYIPADFPTESLVNVTSGTVNNVVPYAFKSAILKGQTLVNLLTYFMPNVDYMDNQYRIRFSNVDNLDKITIVNKNSKTIKFSYFSNGWQEYEIPAFNNVLVEIPKETNEYNIFALDTFGWDSTNYREAIDNIVLLHGDYVNVDIPYFEGMQSVKLPALTTIGKNLFNKDNAYVVGASNQNIRNEVFIKPNTTYTFYANGNNWVGAYLYDKNDILTREVGGERTTTSITFTTTNEEVKVILQYYNGGNTTIESSDFTGVQLEYGTQITSYEPYKTNILTVNEEVELRGIGDVKDTLDCLTGEVVERIGEVVLNGSENWAVNNTQTTTTNRFILQGVIKSDMTDATLSWYMVDKLPKTKWSDSCKLGITLTNGKIFLYNNSIEYNISALKSWLSQNPITIQYQLKTESIKTVDLNNVNQDGVETTFRPFEGTMHIQTDGTPLKPLFSGEIPVEATTQNLASFIDLEGVERNG